MSNRSRRVAFLFAAAGYLAACGDSTGPTGAWTLQVAEAPSTIAAGEIGQITVRVLRNGAGQAGAEVVFQPADGAGIVATPVGITDASGEVRTAWLSGTTAGTQRIVVSTAQAPQDVVIDVQVVPGAPFAVQLAQDSARLFALTAATTFEAAVVDRWGNVIPGLAITWESRDPDVATVEDGGVVRALRVGTAEIVARHGELSASLFLRVVQAPTQIEVTPAAITINALTFERQLELRSWDELGNPIPRPEADWVSLNEAVATVDQQGRVTATGVGTTQIVASAGTAEASVTVTVQQVQASAELVGEPARVLAGETMTVTAFARDSAGQPIPGVNVTWGITGDADAFTILEETADRLVLRGDAVGTLTLSIVAGGMPATYDAQVILPRVMSTHRVAAGTQFSAHTLIILNGQVYAFGRNNFGQIGDGTTSDRYLPFPVPGMTGFVAVAAGTDFSLALRADGTVWGWGRNTHGQLGLGDLDNRSEPVQVPGLTNIIAISAGGLSTSGFTLALGADGTVWAFGANAAGQLGTGDQDLRSEPVQVEDLDGIVAIAAGDGTFSLALREDGSMWGWGTGTSGRLGNGLTSNQLLPSEGVLRRVIALEAGGSHGQALTYDGQVWGFGGNTSGANGTGGTAVQPAPVVGLTNAVDIQAGGNTGVARTADGLMFAWGAGSGGQMGNGTTTLTNNTPVQVHLTGALRVATGGDHMIAEGPTGVFWGWGRNGVGQLGTGDLTNRTEPTQVQFALWSR
jgi:alpha-tubulin suppressor-like RCC1 family protein